MIRKVVFLIMCLMMIGAIGVGVVLAYRTVGVNPGFWVDYAVVYSGNATLPAPHNRPVGIKATVKEVSGTNITYEQILHMADGSVITDTSTVDVDTGQPSGSGLFIAADLYEGDLIYTNPPSSSPLSGATINETTYRNYFGQMEEVNRWNSTKTQTSFPGGNYTTSYESYWFRSTGVIAEATMYMLAQTNETFTISSPATTWMKIEYIIIDIVPEFPPFLILPLLMTATLLTTIAYKRKRQS